MERQAAIDIGTSSTRLLVAATKENVLLPIYEDTVITRLGQGINSSPLLLPAAMERTAKAVTEAYFKACALGAGAVHIFGTSALREAANSGEFCELVRQRTGIKPQVLSGEEEAHLTYLGAARVLGLSKCALIVDVGGGSTEVVLGQGLQVLSASSLKVGAVRLLEKYLLTDPPLENEWGAMIGFLRPLLERNLDSVKDRVEQVVAVGGTATTAAAMLQQLAVYDRQRVQGYIVLRESLGHLIETIRRLPLAIRRTLPGLLPQRADIFPAGAAILYLTLSLLHSSELVVSDADLLQGMLYQRLTLAS